MVDEYESQDDPKELAPVELTNFLFKNGFPIFPSILHVWTGHITYNDGQMDFLKLQETIFLL